MDKIVRKEYEKRVKAIAIKFNYEERVIIKKMMDEDDWLNMSGFIKYKVFGCSKYVRNKYQRMKKEVKPEDIQMIMQNLMTTLSDAISYLNYRFNYELEKLEREKGGYSLKEHRRLLAIMYDWKKAVYARTEDAIKDCQQILHYIDIKTTREQKDSLIAMPDYVLDKVRKDWNNTTSPEALEAARRDMEIFRDRGTQRKTDK